MQAFDHLFRVFPGSLTIVASAWCFASGLDGFAQTIPSMPPSTSAAQHVPSAAQTPPVGRVAGAPLDWSKLPPDVLNCEVCRQRLGLPPLSKSSSGAPHATTLHSGPSVVPHQQMAAPKLAPGMVLDTRTDPMSGVRMLGSPGLISSGTAAKMATEGLVVEEFLPPQPTPGAIQLDGIPLDVRQQFMHGLELPYGARVMSANVLGTTAPNTDNASGVTTAKSVPPKSELVPSATEPASTPRALGAPGIVKLQEAASSVSSGQVSPQPPQLEAPGESASPRADSKPADTEKSQGDSYTDKQVAAPGVTSVTERKVTSDTSPTVNTAQPSSEYQMEQLARANAELQKKLEEMLQVQARRQAEAERMLKDQAMQLEKERQLLATRVAQINEQQKSMQEEMQRRVVQADAANKEVLMMLERRTAEVSDLQARLKQQAAELAKYKESKNGNSDKPTPKNNDKKKSSSKDNENGNRKEENSDKKQVKRPSIDT